MLGLRVSACGAGQILSGLLVASAAHAQASGNWYYCDPAHAYYPYVTTCPMPWRSIAPYAYGDGQAVAPEPALAPPTAGALPGLPSACYGACNTSPSGQPSPAYQKGQADRQAWETWFGGLTGDYRAGAEWWAGQRSLPHPGSCSAAPPSAGADWTAGCFEARGMLAPLDARRKAEPDYRLGWNNPSPVARSAAAAETSATTAPPATGFATSGPTPGYCAGFSPDACQRIQAAVKSQKHPTYCLDQAGPGGSPLIPEQRRICETLGQTPEEMQRAIDRSQAAQMQAEADAMALLQQEWQQKVPIIAEIQMGLSCGFIDQTSGGFALVYLQNVMADEYLHAGTGSTGSADDAGLERVIAAGMQEGKTAANDGACERLTPADRARLRIAVGLLAQFPGQEMPDWPQPYDSSPDWPSPGWPPQH